MTGVRAASLTALSLERPDHVVGDRVREVAEFLLRPRWAREDFAVVKRDEDDLVYGNPLAVVSHRNRIHDDHNLRARDPLPATSCAPISDDACARARKDLREVTSRLDRSSCRTSASALRTGRSSTRRDRAQFPSRAHGDRPSRSEPVRGIRDPMLGRST